MAPTKTLGAPRGTIKGSSALNIVQFTVRAAPIPAGILDYILENVGILKKLQREYTAKQAGKQEDEIEAQEEEFQDHHGDVVRKPTATKEKFWTLLEEKCLEAGSEWEGISDKIWAFGPQKAGGCLLVDARKPNALASLRRKLEKARSEESLTETDRIIGDFDNHVETGFQLAAFQGPLCAEPVEGLAYFVEQLDVDRDALEKEIGRFTICHIRKPLTQVQVKTAWLRSLGPS
jgi:ribosome assembly protein 1